MNASRVFFLTLALVSFLFVTDSAFARCRIRRHAPVKVYAGDDPIQSMHSLSFTVKHGKTARTYGLDDHTEVFICGRRASVEDLHAGMRVSVVASAIHPESARTVNCYNTAIRLADIPKAPAPQKKAHPSKSDSLNGPN